MPITVLRLGHRPSRDARLSTHVGLTARAFGAQGVIFSGIRDKNLLESLTDTAERWGGIFKTSYEKNWRGVIKKCKEKGLCIIHLTMYGVNLPDKIEKLKAKQDLLIVVGGEKVPGEVYQLADYNIAVGNQPHSEVAALAVFLHEYFGSLELKKNFGGKMRIFPQERGKRVIEN